MGYQAQDPPGYLAAPDPIPTLLLTWLRLDVGTPFYFHGYLIPSGVREWGGVGGGGGVGGEEALNKQESDHSLNSKK